MAKMMIVLLMFLVGCQVIAGIPILGTNFLLNSPNLGFSRYHVVSYNPHGAEIPIGAPVTLNATPQQAFMVNAPVLAPHVGSGFSGGQPLPPPAAAEEGPGFSGGIEIPPEYQQYVTPDLIDQILG